MIYYQHYTWTRSTVYHVIYYSTLNMDQVNSVPRDILPALDREQVSSVSRAILSALNMVQVNSVPRDIFSALSIEQGQQCTT